MEKESYYYSQAQINSENTLYSFFSVGNYTIEKIVAFQYMGFLTYNVALADFDKEKNEYSDMSNSNNFDLLKLFATIFKIITNFLNEYPHSSLHIQGNTEIKKKLYQRIVKNNWEDLQNKFIILGVNEGVKAEIFNPNTLYDFLIIRLK